MSLPSAESPEQHDDIDGVAPPAATLTLFGHDGPWQELVSAFRSGRMHHAWLLQGPPGIGKATTAFAFARLILRGGTPAADDRPPVTPDDPTLRQIAQGSHPGLIHLTRPALERGTGFRSQITVDEIRRLSRFFHRTAGEAWRIAIIDPADDMNRSAANALLKVLEEPPERSVFLIANHSPGRLLPTIRSRCRVLRFAPLPARTLEDAIRAILPDVAAADARKAAALADGSLRTALLHLLGGGLEVADRLDRLYQASEPDWVAIQSLADALTQKGREAALDLAVAELFRSLSWEATERLAAGHGEGAARLAALWEREDRRFREAAAFNLDRKQTLLTFFRRLADARR